MFRCKLRFYKLKLYRRTYSVCGKSNKVLGDSRFLLKHMQRLIIVSARTLTEVYFTHIFGMFKEPGFGWLSVGDSFLGGECLQTESVEAFNAMLADSQYVNLSETIERKIFEQIWVVEQLFIIFKVDFHCQSCNSRHESHNAGSRDSTQWMEIPAKASKTCS